MGNKRDHIYEKLKNDIVYLKLKPKEKININSIAKEYKVSNSPIREALIILESEGLIFSIPYSGFFVSDISFEEIKDLFEFRMLLLNFVGKLAAKRITEKEIENLELILEKIKKTKSKSNIIELETRFHRILNNSTKNQPLVNTLRYLEDQVSRLWFFTDQKNKYYLRIPNDFHQMILALKQKDGDTLTKLLQGHAENFIETIKSSLY